LEAKDLLKKVRKVEIKTKRLSNNLFGGEYQSAFKGRGMTFSEVRGYEFGDDVRSIDWNVTARTGSPFVKVFEEERELTVFLVVDISASGEFGSGSQLKRDYGAEVASVLGFSAIKNNDKVFWILVPVLIVLAFLSKQVPSAYIFLSIMLILIYHSLFNTKSKNILIIKNLFFSSLVTIILFILFINFNNINFFSFMDQYLNFPQEIGQKRYEKLNYDFKNIFLDFKFIYFVFFILLFLNIYKLIKIKKFYQKINFQIFLILSLLFISLIHHQILTKNQIYIFSKTLMICLNQLYLQ